jgi:hypothetical protein
MKQYVIVGMIIAAGAGIAVSAIALRLSHKKKAAARIVDLVSYLIAGAGLAAALFAVGAYETRISETGELAELADAALKASDKIHSILEHYCPSTRRVGTEEY